MVSNILDLLGLIILYILAFLGLAIMFVTMTVGAIGAAIALKLIKIRLPRK